MDPNPSEYPWGAAIIDAIDCCLDRLRMWLRRYLSGEFAPPVRKITEKLEKYFIVAGGLALILGLGVSNKDWPWGVHIRCRDPIVYVDWERFLSKMTSQHPGGAWEQAVDRFGLQRSTHSTSFVVYRIEWYGDWQRSFEYMQALRTNKGISVTPEMVADWTVSWRLQSAKQVYGYRDWDTARHDLGHSWGRGDSEHFIDSLNKSPSMAIASLMPTLRVGSVGRGQDFVRDIFYMAAETIPDKLEKSNFYEALREASIFFTPFEVRNDGNSSAANIKLAVSLSDQEIIQEFLDAGAISKGERTGGLQMLNVAVLPPKQAKIILLKSTARPLPASGLLLQERIVAQVADYWKWILLVPLFVFILW